MPVTVTGVTAGNAVFPLQVLFTDESGSTYAVYITADTESRSGRTFHHTFSMTDPRKKYPAVSDDNWDNITRGKVAAEMTRDECRLALGAPDEIERNTGISNTSERWTYENGVYLIFENGLLTRFLQ